MTQTLDGLPYVAGDTTKAAEMIEVSRTSRLARSDRGYEVLGYASGQTVLNGKEFNKTAMFRKRLDDMQISEGQLREDWELLLPATEGDLRTRIRVAFAGMMRPAQIAKVEGSVREIVGGAFDEVGDAGRVDLMEVIWKIPSRMYCDLVSAPREFAPKAAQLSDSVLGPIFTRNLDRRQESIDALYETFDFVAENIARKRENLGDDFTSRMIQQELEGKLSPKEMLFNTVGLLHASIDNTGHQLGIVAGTLLERRDVWDRIVADPTLIPAAVEEAMRLLPRFNVIMRRAEMDVEIEDTLVPAGSWVFVSIPASHRDPEVVPDPEEFRLDRSFRPLSFGGGIYNCLGQHLARLEMNVAIEELVTRYPEARLADGWSHDEFTQANEVRALETVLR